MNEAKAEDVPRLFEVHVLARGKDGLGTPTPKEAERLFAILGPDSRPPDLAGYGLRQDGWEARDATSGGLLDADSA